MKNYYTTLFMYLVTLSLFAQWEQIGGIMEGDNNNDRFGNDIAISEDGSRIVVAPYMPMPLSAIPYVKVFEEVSGEWVQLGSTILEPGINFGDSVELQVSMSADGNRIVVGNKRHLDSNGRVRMFEFNGTDWLQLGQTLIGTESFSEMGDDVEISRDGNRVVIGHKTFGSSVGRVQVFEYNGSSLVQVGQTLIGPINSGFYGTEVSMNNDGSRIAVVASDGVSGSGETTAYELVNNVWQQIGNTLNIEGLGGSTRVDLDASGNTLAISNHLADLNTTNTGLARIYSLVNNVWVQKGDDFIGSSEISLLGKSLDLSNSGDIVAIGVSGGGGGVPPQAPEGIVVVYEFQNGEWIQVFDDISGQWGYFGNSVAISGLGNRVVAGTPLFGQSSGAVEVFENPFLCPLILTCPPNINIQADPVNCEVTNLNLGMPLVSGCLNEVLSNDAPTIFGLGETTVTWTLTGVTGETVTCEQIVSVVDSTNPEFDITSLPVDITVMVPAGDLYTVEDFTTGVTAIDNCSEPLLPITIQQQPVVGSTLPIGMHNITLTALDDAGNTAMHTFVVTVEETLGVVNFDSDNFLMYPNPAKDFISIVGLEINKIHKVALFDITGRIVLNHIEKGSSIRIALKLPAGIYFVEIKHQKGEIVQQLIIK